MSNDEQSGNGTNTIDREQALEAIEQDKKHREMAFGEALKALQEQYQVAIYALPYFEQGLTKTRIYIEAR